jgi:hypothetical protein
MTVLLLVAPLHDTMDYVFVMWSYTSSGVCAGTVHYAHADLDIMISALEADCTRLIDWFDSNHMKANPDKFQAIAFGKRTHNKNISLKVGNFDIPCEEEVKLLGVTLDFLLSFDKHIADLCKKTSRQLNVLKRIGHYLNRECKLLIYHSFILSNFNYCPLAWHFCSVGNTRKLERIQERALRFIYEDHDSSYDALLQKSKFPSLHIRRLKSMAIEVYKIFSKQGPTHLHDLLILKNSSYSFRYENVFTIPRVRTTKYGLRSFRYTGAKLWNDLPNEFRTVASFSQFRRMIDSWNGLKCNCNVCTF